MAPLRTLQAGAAAVLGLTLALTGCLGSTPALAAPPVPGHAAGAITTKAPAGVAFQPLALVNGWASAQGPFRPTGDPSVGFSNGVVYLSGSLYQASGTSNRFATLVVGVNLIADGVQGVLDR